MKIMTQMTWNLEILVPGEATGQPLILDEPLSLWGGLDPHTGEIIDRRHPQSGKIVSDRVLILPAGRGSSSASSILLEAVRSDKAPVAIVTAEKDGILTLGAVVAQEIYKLGPTIGVLPNPGYDELCQAIGEQAKAMLQISENQLKLIAA
ncbi:MAG: DUF126 domain-containing protein [Chloroflexota bacterium]